MKNRVWFYTGARHRVNDLYIQDCLQPNGSLCEGTTTQTFNDGKMTFQMNQAHRLIGYYQVNAKDPVSGASSLVDWSARNIALVLRSRSKSMSR